MRLTHPMNPAGKGSKPRPMNQQAYRDNFDSIDWGNKPKVIPKTFLGKSDKIKDPASMIPASCSYWIEWGTYYYASTVDPKKFGPHAYDGNGYNMGIRDCPCGCSIGSSTSRGPVDPFGACPANPL